MSRLFALLFEKIVVTVFVNFENKSLIIVEAHFFCVYKL